MQECKCIIQGRNNKILTSYEAFFMSLSAKGKYVWDRKNGKMTGKESSYDQKEENIKVSIEIMKSGELQWRIKEPWEVSVMEKMCNLIMLDRRAKEEYGRAELE